MLSYSLLKHHSYVHPKRLLDLMMSELFLETNASMIFSRNEAGGKYLLQCPFPSAFRPGGGVGGEGEGVFSLE